MYKKIVLAGGSGFLGRELASYYADKAETIIVLTRGLDRGSGRIRFVSWDGETQGAWTEALEGADLLVNLSGKSVNCRYTNKAKAEILESRIRSTAALGAAIRGLKVAPRVWIQAASATIYRHAEDRPQTEATGEAGTGFSVSVCQSWESCFEQEQTPATRKIILRVALVLGREDGVFPRFRNLVRVGLGGPQGTGRQMVSWIHVADFVRLTEWLLETESARGIYNASAPGVVPNRVFMKTIRMASGRQFGLPAPAWLLRIGALVIGTETELLLKSRWVSPQRLLDEGFRFQFGVLADAVANLV